MTYWFINTRIVFHLLLSLEILVFLFIFNGYLAISFFFFILRRLITIISFSSLPFNSLLEICPCHQMQHVCVCIYSTHLCSSFFLCHHIDNFFVILVFASLFQIFILIYILLFLYFKLCFFFH